MDTNQSTKESEGDFFGDKNKEEGGEDKDPPPMEKSKIIAEAIDIHGSEGQVEIYDDTEVSVSDDGGYYVQAWVWVDKDKKLLNL